METPSPPHRPNRSSTNRQSRDGFPGRAERHRGAALDVEHVGLQQVGVAVGVAGGDRGQVDGGGDRGRGERVADHDVAVEPGEVAAHLRDAEVADREAHRRVEVVDRPATGDEEERGGGGRRCHGRIVGPAGAGGKAGSILVVTGPG